MTSGHDTWANNRGWGGGGIQGTNYIRDRSLITGVGGLPNGSGGQVLPLHVLVIVKGGRTLKVLR